MKVHRTYVEKRECYEYAEIADDVIKRLPQHDLTNTTNWTESDWLRFWEDLYELSEEGSEQIIQSEVVYDYDDTVQQNWIEKENN